VNSICPTPCTRSGAPIRLPDRPHQWNCVATLPRMTSEPLPAPPPPPRRRRTRRVVIALGVVVAFVVILCCAGVAYVGYDGYRAPREEREMEAFATGLCLHLVAGDADAVYAALSADAH